MRRFAVCFSSLTVFAASIVSGCSSDNTTPSDAGGDTNTTTMDSSTIDAPAESSAVDAGKEAAACVPVDASVETIAVGSQWACFQSACSSQLTACAADCVCNLAIFGALNCSAAGGSATTCFGSVLQSTGGNPAVGGALLCLSMNTSTCSATEGGVEGGTEGGAADGGTDSGVDGGAEGGAADGPVTDAPTDG
jgi:hypothetical protein